MSNIQTSIALKGITTGYHARNSIEITRDINAEIRPSELTCLLGPNGAGKSTLLKTLSAFIPPLSGSIEIFGRNLKDYSEAKLARTISVVLTERISINNMTVRELVEMGRSPYTGFWGRLSRHDREIVDDAIDMVAIRHLSARQMQTLSDGERQKALIAKSLAQETPVVFLDEPTAFLDYPSKVEIMQLLLRLARLKNKTVFLSTHDLELALQIADNIWLLDKNHGLCIGTPEDLSLNGQMARFFEREGVRFDIESGLFKIRNELTEEIGISGSGPRKAMAAKALGRVGIRASEKSCSQNAVEVTDKAFVLNGHIVCQSIGELIDAVRNLTAIGNEH